MPNQREAFNAMYTPAQGASGKIKRSGWDANVISYLFLLSKFNIDSIMAVTKRGGAPDDVIKYDPTHDDLISNDWVIMP